MSHQVLRSVQELKKANLSELQMFKQVLFKRWWFSSDDLLKPKTTGPNSTRLLLIIVRKPFLLQWKILRGCACRCAFVCCYGCKCVKFDSQERDTEGDWDQFQLPSNKNSKTPTFYPPGKVIHVVKTVSIRG